MTQTLTLTISIDPGKYCTGVALFREGLLVRALLVRIPKVEDEEPVCRWVRMSAQVYKEVLRAANPQEGVSLSSSIGDLISGTFRLACERMTIRPSRLEASNAVADLQGTLGSIVAVLNPKESVSYLPEQWKRQLPKDIAKGRVYTRLDVDEVLALEDSLDGIPQGLRHNVFDAVGIGLHSLDRRIF